MIFKDRDEPVRKIFKKPEVSRFGKFAENSRNLADFQPRINLKKAHFFMETD